MALACELPGTIFRKCGKPASGVCRWCGKPFCSDHRSRLAANHPVCNSESCTAKAAIATTAGSARQRAQAHNREGLCGLPTCGNRLPGATCRICGSEYCPAHLTVRLFRVSEPAATNSGEGKRVAKKERFFVCDQCIGLVDRYGAIELPIELEV